MLVESFFAYLRYFDFLSQTDHFAFWSHFSNISVFLEPFCA